MTQPNESGRWTRKEIRESRCFAQSTEAKIRHDNTVFYSADKAVLKSEIEKALDKIIISNCDITIDRSIHINTFARQLRNALSLSKSEEEKK
jgi:hypothetical protein